MKIDILCNDGSPLGVTPKTIWGDDRRIGVGGAELALLTMCEIWQNAGYDVTLYNDPIGEYGKLFDQRPIGLFHPLDDRDILITFRSPNVRSIAAKGYKVWWSCDQYTIGDFKNFSRFNEKIVCISDFHVGYFKSVYGITNADVIDLPVRLEDFNKVADKIPNRFIFTSVPDRGLFNLWRIWEGIKKQIPDATLVITSDYRLWGVGANNEQYRVKWSIRDGVQFLGAVPRTRMISELLLASIFLYPCSYDELFCISCAEAQVAGAYPVTSIVGALTTTNMGTIIGGDANNPHMDKVYIETVKNLLQDNNFVNLQKENQNLAIRRFSPQRIKTLWDEKVFNYA